MSTVWDDFEVISVYTRKQAIEDGVLVQLSGPGYEGHAWVPEMAAELGFKFPLAMTSTAFFQYVDLTAAAERAGNDIKGRLWDVLYMLRIAIGRSTRQTNVIAFELHCVARRIKPDLVRLKCVCGPGDDAEPVLTIMLPEED